MCDCIADGVNIVGDDSNRCYSLTVDNADPVFVGEFLWITSKQEIFTNKNMFIVSGIEFIS